MGHLHSHSPAARVDLSPEQGRILRAGLKRLLKASEGLEFRPLPSAKYPLPLCNVVYPEVPPPERVRGEVASLLEENPAAALEPALALLELVETNRDETAGLVLDDMKFVGTAFSSKRANGWAAVLGSGDRSELEEAVNSKWRFRFFSGPEPCSGVYLLLNALARYAFVYGKVPFGDAHGAGHFVEDHTPGLLFCCGRLDEFELTLALMAMKMGVPAIVPVCFPFPFGKTIRVDRLEHVVEAAVAFPNIRRLLSLPEIPQFPEYASPEHSQEQVEPAFVWGGREPGFFVVRKGTVPSQDVTVRGKPPKGDAPIGITVTIDAEPLDEMDRRYMERSIASGPAMIKGVGVEFREGSLALKIAEGAQVEPYQVAEVLMASVQHNFPQIRRVGVEVSFDRSELERRFPEVKKEIAVRAAAAGAVSEETIDRFYSCVGCSQFAPDHVCILTPERPPMCGRPFEMIKTGALYGYDDMSNLHHSAMYRELNSFGFLDKGECLDPERGEWSGANAHAAKLTQGRTWRVFLHSVDEFPHTGCGCFGFIIFRTERPRPGIGIVARGFEGTVPDGRTWADLYYEQAGKQNPGSTGASAGYFRSPKFLKAHGGWDAVVWVSPKVAAVMGEDLPSHVEVGT